MTALRIPIDRPSILVAEEELGRLSEIAEGLRRSMPDTASFLEEELDRARVVPRRKIPAGVVTMEAEVEFLLEPRKAVERLRLVWPSRDPAEGCVSIASPVGVALLGLRTGQRISWRSRLGQRRTLRVTEVVPARGQMTTTGSKAPPG